MGVTFQEKGVKCVSEGTNTPHKKQYGTRNMTRLKRFLFALTLSAGLAGMAHVASADAPGWQIDISDAGETYHMTYNAKAHLLALEGFPVEGVYYLDTRSNVMYLQNPAFQGTWFRLAPYADGRGAMDAQFKRVGSGPDMAGSPTTQWQLNVNRKACADVFGSTKWGQRVGLGLAEFSQINLSFAVLYNLNPYLEPCLMYNVSPAIDSLVGLPLRLVTDNTDVTTITKVTPVMDEAKLPVLPQGVAQNAKPVTDALKIAFIREQMPAQQWAAFVQATPPNLTDAEKLKALTSLRTRLEMMHRQQGR